MNSNPMTLFGPSNNVHKAGRLALYEISCFGAALGRARIHSNAIMKIIPVLDEWFITY